MVDIRSRWIDSDVVGGLKDCRWNKGKQMNPKCRGNKGIWLERMKYRAGIMSINISSIKRTPLPQFLYIKYHKDQVFGHKRLMHYFCCFESSVENSILYRTFYVSIRSNSNTNIMAKHYRLLLNESCVDSMSQHYLIGISCFIKQ